MGIWNVVCVKSLENLILDAFLVVDHDSDLKNRCSPGRFRETAVANLSLTGGSSYYDKARLRRGCGRGHSVGAGHWAGARKCAKTMLPRALSSNHETVCIMSGVERSLLSQAMQESFATNVIRPLARETKLQNSIEQS